MAEEWRGLEIAAPEQECCLPRYSRLKRVKNPDDLAATEAKCEEYLCFFNSLGDSKGSQGWESLLCYPASKVQPTEMHRKKTTTDGAPSSTPSP